MNTFHDSLSAINNPPELHLGDDALRLVVVLLLKLVSLQVVPRLLSLRQRYL